MFKRKYNIILQPLVWAKYKMYLNTENIESISKRQVTKLFKGELHEAKQWYVHYVLRKWLSSQDTYQRKMMDRLKKIIKKLDINLSPMDQHDLVRIEERIFFTERTLKNLDTHHIMDSGEQLLARFEKAKFNKLETQKIQLIKTMDKKDVEVIKHLETGILLITNKRFIFEMSNLDTLDIKFKNIKHYSHQPYGFEVSVDKDTYILRTRDQKALNNMIELIFKRRVKNVIKKCKNN